MKAQALRMRRPSPTATTNFDSAYVTPVTAPSGLRQGRLRQRVWNRSFDWVPDFRQMNEAPVVTGATDASGVLDVNPGLPVRRAWNLPAILPCLLRGNINFT